MWYGKMAGVAGLQVHAHPHWMWQVSQTLCLVCSPMTVIRDKKKCVMAWMINQTCCPFAMIVVSRSLSLSDGRARGHWPWPSHGGATDSSWSQLSDSCWHNVCHPLPPKKIKFMVYGVATTSRSPAILESSKPLKPDLPRKLISEW